MDEEMIYCTNCGEEVDYVLREELSDRGTEMVPYCCCCGERLYVPEVEEMNRVRRATGNIT